TPPAAVANETSADAPGIPVPTPRPGLVDDVAETPAQPDVVAQVQEPVEPPVEAEQEAEDAPPPPAEPSVALAIAPLDQFRASWAVDAQPDAGQVGSIET